VPSMALTPSGPASPFAPALQVRAGLRWYDDQARRTEQGAAPIPLTVTPAQAHCCPGKFRGHLCRPLLSLTCDLIGQRPTRDRRYVSCGLGGMGGWFFGGVFAIVSAPIAPWFRPPAGGRVTFLEWPRKVTHRGHPDRVPADRRVSMVASVKGLAPRDSRTGFAPTGAGCRDLVGANPVLAAPLRP
jgi:hypothetical protein